MLRFCLVAQMSYRGFKIFQDFFNTYLNTCNLFLHSKFPSDTIKVMDDYLMMIIEDLNYESFII